jgi:hypothetical protein
METKERIMRRHRSRATLDSFTTLGQAIILALGVLGAAVGLWLAVAS